MTPSTPKKGRPTPPAPQNMTRLKAFYLVNSDHPKARESLTQIRDRELRGLKANKRDLALAVKALQEEKIVLSDSAKTSIGKKIMSLFSFKGKGARTRKYSALRGV